MLLVWVTAVVGASVVASTGLSVRVVDGAFDDTAVVSLPTVGACVVAEVVGC